MDFQRFLKRIVGDHVGQRRKGLCEDCFGLPIEKGNCRFDVVAIRILLGQCPISARYLNRFLGDSAHRRLEAVKGVFIDQRSHESAGLQRISDLRFANA